MALGDDAREASPCKRLSLSSYTKRRLWSESGGHCQRLECAAFLFSDDNVDFAEMAHIISATTGGPRDDAQAPLTEAERAHHTNVAVLCANCHTIVDKSPGEYPADLLRQWKTRRIEELAIAVGTPVFPTRKDARAYLAPLLSSNKSIVSAYGPTDTSGDLERAQSWKHHAATTIVRNNQKIDRALHANWALLTLEEQATASSFSIHQDEFALRHLIGDHDAGMSRYPAKMDDILNGES